MRGINAPIKMTLSPQPAAPDTLLQCFVLISKFLNVNIESSLLKHATLTRAGHLSHSDLLLLSKDAGMRAKSVTKVTERLLTLPLPAIIQNIDGTFFVLARLGNQSAPGTVDRVLIHNPTETHPQVIPLQTLNARAAGTAFIFSPRKIELNNLRFGFKWFLPALFKYRKLLREVLIASLIVQLLALATPLFFQVITDKVLTHHAVSTLDVIAFGLLITVLFDVLLNTARTYLFTHTTNRVDVELSSSLFRHLISLPLPYFTARRTGDSVARVRELENIRNFITSTGLTVILDIMFSVVFLAVMTYYSPKLTLIVCASIPLYAVLSLFLTPILRSRLNEKFHRGAENQSFLVESVSGIHTVKSMAVEPLWGKKWDEQLAAYLTASFKAFSIGNFANAGVTLISKLITIFILYYGAHAVIAGEMSVGQLIAFNMLANHISAPIIRLAQLWSDFQQVGVSVERLSDILNTPSESNGGSQILHKIKGKIAFENVCFRYQPDAANVLEDISISIAPGEIVGIVGRSGSGKSTFTKLIQKLILPSAGTIRVDGHNLAMLNAASLRRGIGVVMQENVLFSGTVRENIAMAVPLASLEDVIKVASLAGAHEFILEFPMGYDTIVGESGSTLSGGQRQRIAIARALMTDPRILILDEATSALDYESEQIIHKNLQLIAKGRTVLIIAHRLTAVRDATRIIVLDKGRLVEEGSHHQLVANVDGHYSSLYKLQHL